MDGQTIINLVMKAKNMEDKMTEFMRAEGFNPCKEFVIYGGDIADIHELAEQFGYLLRKINWQP